MSNDLVIRHSVTDIQQMAKAIADSGMFGVKTPQQAMALMLIAQAEGRHPASAAQDYNVIQGRPALKADAMLARYQAAGGKIKWGQMTNECVSAVFTHPASGDVEISWDMKRAADADLLKSGMFRKFPRQMLRARVISEGVRASFPGVLGGMYTPEEVGEMQPVVEKPKPFAPPPVVEKTPEPVVVDAAPRDMKSIEAASRAVFKKIGWKATDWADFCIGMFGNEYKSLDDSEKVKAHAAFMAQHGGQA